MKNLKKVLAVMTAVTAMAASTSAFAADANTVAFTGDFEGKGTYAIPENGTAYKFGVTTDFADTTKGDMTLLVLTEGALTTEDTEVSDDEILYIDQGDAFTGLGLKTITVDGEAKEVIDVPTEGDGYIVKVGYYDANGNFAIKTGNFTITEPVVEPDVPPQPPVNYVDWKFGNVDCDAEGSLGALDCVAILKGTVNETTYGDFIFGKTYKTQDDKTFKFGNVDCDAEGSLGALDCVAILKGTVNETTYGDFTFGQTYQFNPTPVE